MKVVVDLDLAAIDGWIKSMRRAAEHETTNTQSEKIWQQRLLGFTDKLEDIRANAVDVDIDEVARAHLDNTKGHHIFNRLSVEDICKAITAVAERKRGGK